MCVVVLTFLRTVQHVSERSEFFGMRSPSGGAKQTRRERSVRVKGVNFTFQIWSDESTKRATDDDETIFKFTMIHFNHQILKTRQSFQ